MKERPILFSAPMVRAILADIKTQTRRTIKGDLDDEERLHVGMYHPTVIDRQGDEQPGPEVFGAWTTNGEWAMKCPYGQPGDRLWVRETFQQFSEDGEILYKADKAGFDAMNELKRDEFYEARWRPSIHMPRWASRITLEVTGVKVERLQDISEADAAAEGIIRQSTTGWFSVPGLNGAGTTARAGYALLWNSIHGPGSWEANPWVWCVSFLRVSPNTQTAQDR